jgi:adenylosuccinate lyase
LKTLRRGKRIDADSMRAFIRGLALPEAAKKRLLELLPGTYTGLAEKLARRV